MNKKYYNHFVVEDKHPFDTHYIPKNATFLVIGTFPTHKRNYKSTFEFFYAGEGNVFWPVMEKIFNKHFSFSIGPQAVEERKQFLIQKGIGITDMLVKCYRHEGRSQDHHIFPILLNDIFKLLDENKSIDTIILTSRTKVVGALGLFETYLYQRDIKPPSLKMNGDKILEGWLTRNDREYNVLVPYSTSKTVIEEKRTDLSQLESMYKCCLT